MWLRLFFEVQEDKNARVMSIYKKNLIYYQYLTFLVLTCCSGVIPRSRIKNGSLIRQCDDFVRIVKITKSYNNIQVRRMKCLLQKPVVLQGPWNNNNLLIFQIIFSGLFIIFTLHCRNMVESRWQDEFPVLNESNVPVHLESWNSPSSTLIQIIKCCTS